ncbi:MAG TPA: MoxR family ATPase [Longimicrobiales bacterium]|nr:MoxR family ATPase [Longimicrobiales bacterium]
MTAPTLSPGHRLLDDVVEAVHRRVVGQHQTVEGLLIALLTGGHVLLEGLPGLAKTLLVRSLAGALHTTFRRIQFTPDLLPGDVIGMPVYHQGTGEFRVYQGPIFANLVLADEVNRAPPKVQSALLEAMEEEQVTIDGTTYPLPSPFLVLATQNPIEQQGTYPLAEAQLDRFMMKLRISYPRRDEEREILERVALAPAGSERERDAAEAVADDRSASAPAILEARAELDGVRVDRRIQDYVVELVFATREPARAGLADFEKLLEFGASPRATIFLTRAARALAYLRGRDYVLPDDVKAVAHPVLRHRLRTTYEADARGIDADQLIDRLLLAVPAP